MENQIMFQKLFFDQIKKKLPANIAVVQEIAEILNISKDSAYRRINVNKQLTFNELHKLSKAFNISVDHIFLNRQSDNLIFQNRIIKPDNKSFENWLNAIASDLKIMAGVKEKQIIYSAKDPPIWHHWNFPDIAAFKVFFWKKTILQIPEYANKKFSFDEYDTRIHEIGHNILRYSTKIPTVEIWNEDTFNILLKQIEYYWVSGFFRFGDDIFRLYNSLVNWAGHIQKQAELGFKFIYGSKPEGLENTYKLYENEIVLNDNSILTNVNERKIYYLTYNTLNLLISTDPGFIEHINIFFNMLISKSMLISSSASKERNRFFNKLTGNINLFKRKLNQI